MDYSLSFQNRVDSFLNAINTYNCYDNELKIAVDILNCKTKQKVVNLGGGGLNINKFLSSDIQYIPLEFSKEFSERCNIPLTNYNKLPLNNEEIDRFLILALLHHFTEEERFILYTEIFRCLKQDGIFVLSDVIIGSEQDKWLNQIVNKYNPFGHNGRFFSEKDRYLFEQVGFKVENKIIIYDWIFKDEKEMCLFMKELFYLNISEEKLKQELYDTFIIKKENNEIKLQWKLIYFINTK